MKLEGFIGPAYELDSVNVDAQRCVNLYLEAIESGAGKQGQQVYYRGTPGLNKLIEVGDGPIRCLHTDSIGRQYAVSGPKIYHISQRSSWSLIFTPVSYDPGTVGAVNTGSGLEQLEVTDHGYYTGLKFRISSSGSVPGGLSEGTDYYVIRNTDDFFQVATSFSNALAGTTVNLTSAGSGTITVTPQITQTLTISYASGLDDDNNYFYSEGHGLETGQEVQFKTNGTYPTNVTYSTSYYIIVIDADNFQLATSTTNANAGTALSFTDGSTDGLNAIELGTLGIFGGDEITMLTSTGIVKAASFALAGDGSDSSTVFVDGAANYFLDDQPSGMSFGATGLGSIAQVTFSGGDFDGLVISSSDTGLVAADLNLIINTKTITGTTIQVTFSTDGTDYTFSFSIPTGAQITSEQFARLVNSGNFSEGGFDFAITDGNTNGVLATMSVAGGSSNAIDNSTVDDSETFASVQDPSTISYTTVPGATNVVWTDGYFIVDEGNTNRFFASELQSFNIGALDFASSEGSPDIVKAIEVSRRDLYVFNDLTTEVYANTGNADFPFERVQGGFLEVGCAARYSVARIDTTICWLGRSKDGEGRIYAIEGLQHRRISTHAIEQKIASYADITTAVAWTYQLGGHGFYVLNFDEATWVYDFATGVWHERAYLNNGTLERHRAQVHTFDPFTQRHLVGDYENNKIYLLQEDYNYDDTSEIKRLRSSPHITNDLKWIFYHKFQLDMEVGIGLDGGVQGSNPTVMLDFSDDGGHTWSSETFTLADEGGGQIGNYLKRVIWRRLGKSRDRIFRVQITDPVKIRIIAANIDITAGAS